MPDFDRTGPSGKGPLTGRKRGRCRRSSNKTNKIEEASDSGKRFDFGRGRRNNGECRRRGDQGWERRSGE